MSKKKTSGTVDLSKVNLTFSFEYYDTNPKTRFCLSGWQEKDIKFTLGRLREICQKSLSTLQRERKVYHFYQTDWSNSIYPKGFPNEIKTLNNLDPFHFSIVGLNNTKARVFGAVSRSTFYVVWFDYDHEILPTKLKNT